MACVLWASAGSAQNSEPASPAPPTTVEQRTERLTQQDAGSRIEELRVGGQTRRISVETPTAVPGYEVTPAEQTTGQAGRSSWRLLRF
jgi:hypothetical protein